MAGPTVVSFETDFIPKGEAMLRGFGKSTRIMSKWMDYVSGEIIPILNDAVFQHTPVSSKDTAHHRSGSLQESTETFVSKSDQMMSEGGTSLKDIVEQFVIEVDQGAVNTQGQVYAPWVIGPHGSYAGNPYPSEAVLSVLPQMQSILSVVAREMTQETVDAVVAETATVGFSA